MNLCWLALQAAVLLYNAWVIPLRWIFPHVQQESNVVYWLLADYAGDALHLLDVLVFKRRVAFIEDGFWVRDRARITRNYVSKGTFLWDLLALLPTDLLYLQLGLRCTIVRLPRLLKVIALWEFMRR